MAGTPQLTQPRMSLSLFRQFVEDRPDKEHWELIDGVPMMMAPPTIGHQIIAGNLQRLLYDALENHAPTFVVCQRAGVNLAPAVKDYDPEPDIVVIDSVAAERPGERYASRFHLVAEIVSSSDRVDVERKRAVYKLHEACRCILTVQQDRFEVRIDLRIDDAWREQTLTRPDDLLVLSEFGLRCTVSDLYRGTALHPRQARQS